MFDFFKKKKVPYMIFSTYISIYDLSLDTFMKYKPPCKKCLVQGMCLKCITKSEYRIYRIHTDQCNSLTEFITNHKHFEEFTGGLIQL